MLTIALLNSMAIVLPFQLVCKRGVPMRSSSGSSSWIGHINPRPRTALAFQTLHSISLNPIAL